jgi:hypothetical protein
MGEMDDTTNPREPNLVIGEMLQTAMQARLTLKTPEAAFLQTDPRAVHDRDANAPPPCKMHL